MKLASLLLGVSIGVSAMLLWRGRPEPDVELYRELRDFIAVHALEPHDDQELLDLALKGMAEGLDPYSRYCDPSETRMLERETEGRYRGIGAIFRQPIAQAQILYTLPGSPAAKAGLTPGDRLLRIGSHLVAELGEAGLRQELSRDQGGELELEVAARDGKLRTVRLRKDSLVDPSVTDVRMLQADQGIAYVALHSFTHATPGEFDAALRDLNAAGMRGLVLDLRGNAGGVLASAVDLARRFLTRGVIVRTEGRLRVATHHAESAQAAYAGLPLIVLIDEGSASASEVLAGALQDHRLAVIVGERSWGKGTVQTLQRFPEHGTLAKITTARYETPSGRVLERSLDPEGRGGIQPDLEVSLPAAERRSIHERLARPMPDPLARQQLERWEIEETIQLVPHFYIDAQLQAAIDLLSGNRPAVPAPLAEQSPR